MFCTPTAAAIALGHIGIWKRVARGTDAAALVLEDDAVLCPDFKNALQRVMRHVPPDFDVVLLDSTVPNACTSVQVSPTVRQPWFFAGTHAYVVSRKGAAYLVCQNPVAKWHIDLQIALLTPGLKLYQATPSLAANGSLAPSRMTQSATAGHGEFPSNLPWYFMHVHMFRLGTWKHHVRVSPVHVIMLALGMMRFPNTLVMMAIAVDAVIALMRGNHIASPRDVLIKLAFFVVGMRLRTSFGVSSSVIKRT